MKRYIRTSLIFALLLFTTSTSFSLPAFNDLCRSRGLPLPDKDADKIILPIEKPEIPEEPEYHEYSPRPEISEETVDYVVVLLPPMYSRTMYRYVLKDGRVFYTDVNYFPEIDNNQTDIKHTTLDKTTIATNNHKINASLKTETNTTYKTPYEYLSNMTPEQRWVIENIYTGTRWEPIEMLNRFGMYERYDPEDGNPQISQMFYFKNIDMTFMVNLLKNQIQTWRFGRAYK